MHMQRGTFNFETSAVGGLADSEANLDALRKLWLDRTLISGNNLGPGNPGDFDVGAWHVGCHVVAAGGVRRSRDGRVLWLEVSHDAGRDQYFASVTSTEPGGPRTRAITALESRTALEGSQLLGFVEGNSTGRISAAGVSDSPERFNSWQRQDFDKPVSSDAEGGKVWEHWCTLRDIRATSDLATSVLKAYVSLCAALGDRFVPTVARGRRQYGHPVQLCAMVQAGLTTKEAAVWDTQPVVVPEDIEPLLLAARPSEALAAAEKLRWGDQPTYYMFQRRIAKWSPAASVQQDLRAFSR